MTDRVPAEAMEDPPTVAYAIAAVLVAAGALVAVAAMPERRPELLAGLVVLAVIASISGWLFSRKGYTFVEGWFAGALFFPLAIAFGLWGPRRTEASR